MKQEEDQAQPRSGAIPGGGIQPPGSRASIYLSWGGKIYGPSTREEVIAGIRTAWFEEGALYWQEGLPDWKPVVEFPVDAPAAKRQEAHGIMPGGPPSAPSLPATARTRGSPHQHPRRQRTPKPATRRLDRSGRAIFLGFALLAVLLTVGLLLLLMLV